MPISKPKSGRSNVIPFTDKPQVSFNPAFERLGMPQMMDMLDTAKYFLTSVQTEVSKRNQAKRGSTK